MLYKIACMFFLLLLFPVLTARGAVDTEMAFHIPFIVHTNGVSFTVQEADAVLNKARDFLMHDDHLQISFGFDEKIIAQDKIKGCEDIKKLLDEGSDNVHMVNDIPCCGSFDEIRDGKINGCSGPTTAIIVVIREDHSMNPEILLSEAVLWMHEIGHNKGLCHNDVPGKLMSTPPTTGNTKLDDCEQAIFTNNITALCKPACGITPS